MIKQSRNIWIWQRIISPHMSGLVAALARQGCQVVFVVEREMSTERADQGWDRPDIGNATIEMASSEKAVLALVEKAPDDSIHVCEGFRANGYISIAQAALAKRRLLQLGLVETVDDAGVIGAIRKLIYLLVFRKWNRRLVYVLAIGCRTSEWIAARGFPRNRIFPFAYFLPGIDDRENFSRNVNDRFRFIFVGQFVELKRLGLLITVLSEITDRDFELTVVGSGPMEFELCSLSERILPGRVRWLGKLPMETVHEEMKNVDCLVLPSRYDGWGAVVSEALIRGTPVITSDACGSSVVVESSGVGGVFDAHDRRGLRTLLCTAIDNQKPSPYRRRQLSSWARCLGAEAGADYFLRIVAHLNGESPRPLPPWDLNK